MWKTFGRGRHTIDDSVIRRMRFAFCVSKATIVLLTKYDLYSTPNIVWVIKSRRMRWAGHVARMGEERGVYMVLVGTRRERDHWGDLGVDGWMILRRISRRWDVGMWTGLGWPRIETGGGRL